MNTESTKCEQRRMTPLWPLAGLWLTTLAGCYHAPEYSILGSLFPVWIFVSVIGLLLAMGARLVIARTAIAEHLASPVILYLSMATFFACMLWLLFYN